MKAMRAMFIAFIVGVLAYALIALGICKAIDNYAPHPTPPVPTNHVNVRYVPKAYDSARFNQ